MPSTKPQVASYVDPVLYERLTQAAESDGVSMSTYIGGLLRTSLDMSGKAQVLLLLDTKLLALLDQMAAQDSRSRSSQVEHLIKAEVLDRIGDV